MTGKAVAYNPVDRQQRQSFGQRVRERIDSSLIVERLCKVAMGQDEMTANELKAADMLLKRTIPELKPLETKQEAGQDAKTITNADLFSIIEGQAKRIDRK